MRDNNHQQTLDMTIIHGFFKLYYFIEMWFLVMLTTYYFILSYWYLRFVYITLSKPVFLTLIFATNSSLQTDVLILTIFVLSKLEHTMFKELFQSSRIWL